MKIIFSIKKIVIFGALFLANNQEATIGFSHVQANTVAIQDDGKIVAAGQVTFNNIRQFIVVRYTVFGLLDLTFGNNGIVTTIIGNGSSATDALTIQSNGSIIAAGYAQFNSTEFVLARYLDNGSLDTSFNTIGTVSTEIGDGSTANACAVQADGKIIVAGVMVFDGQASFVLVRYNIDGSLDETFSSEGVARTSIGDRALIKAIALQADEKILVSGYSLLEGSQDFTLARYNTDGSLDSFFGSNGIVTTTIGSAAVANSVAVQSDDKIIAGGISDNAFCIARYNSDGSLDASFGDAGVVKTSIGSNSQINDIVIQADDNIVAVGFADSHFALARYLSVDGTLDSSFGNNGIVITASSISDYAAAVALQSDGKIVAAGTSDNNFMMVRYNANGSLDTSFGSMGIVINPNTSEGPNIFGIVNDNIGAEAGIIYSKLNLTNGIIDSDINVDAAIADSKLATIQTPGKVANQATSASTSSVAGTIVARDALANVYANRVYANLNGNVVGYATANVLKAGDTMTGSLILPAGTLSVPSLQFSGNNNSGFSCTADTLALSTNGSGRLTINSLGNVVIAAPISGTGFMVNGGGALVVGDIASTGNLTFNSDAIVLNALGSTQGPLVKVFSGTAITDLNGNATIDYTDAGFSTTPLIFTQTTNGVIGSLGISGASNTSAIITNGSLINTNFNYLAMGV